MAFYPQLLFHIRIKHYVFDPFIGLFKQFFIAKVSILHIIQTPFKKQTRHPFPRRLLWGFILAQPAFPILCKRTFCMLYFLGCPHGHGLRKTAKGNGVLGALSFIEKDGKANPL